MNLDEFETEYRNVIDASLNQLQTAVLLIAQLENNINSIGQNLQSLSQTLEEYVAEQKSK